MEDTLQIRNVTLTMYAGTLNKISEAIGGMSGLDKLAYSDEVKNKLVSTICKKYEEEGNEEGYLSAPFTLSADEYKKILEWGIEQFTVFTVNSSNEVIKILNQAYEKIQKDLKPTQNG